MRTASVRWILAGLLAVGIVGAARRLKVQLASLAVARAEGTHPIPSTFARGEVGGVDVAGAGVLAAPPGTRYVVPFVLHASRLRAQLPVWEAARMELLQQSDVFLIGFCDGTACTAEMIQDEIHSRIPIIEFGSYRLMDEVARADRLGLCLVLDRVTGKVTSFSCDPGPGSGDTLAAAIERQVRP